MSTSLKQSILQEPSDRKAMIGFGFSLFWDQFNTFVLVNGIGALIMSLPVLMASEYLLWWLMGDQRSLKQLSIYWMTNTDRIVGVTYVFLSLVISLYLIVFNVVHTRRVIDGSSDLWGSLSETTRQLVPVIGTSLISGFFIVIPLIVMLIVSVIIISVYPGSTMRLGPTWFFLFFLWTIYAIKLSFDWMFEFIVPLYHSDRRYFKALVYSKQIVTDKRWTIFWNIIGYALIFWVLVNVLLFLLGAVLNIVLSDVVHPLTIIGSNLISFITLPLVWMTGFVVYFLRLDAVYQSKYQLAHTIVTDQPPTHPTSSHQHQKADHTAHHAQHDQHRDLDDAKTTELIG